MTDIDSMDIKLAVTYLRHLLAKCGIALSPDTLLFDFLNQTEAFVHNTSLRPSPAFVQDMEDEIIADAQKYLAVFRLASTYKALDRKKVPKRYERLRHDLAPKKLNNTDQKEQFFDFEYETYCAAEFTFGDHRSSFISDNMNHPSRYKKRVEFLIDNRSPAECKRPRKSTNVQGLVNEAIAKVDEREKSGVVCVSLDLAFKDDETFQQYENVDDFVLSANKKFAAFAEKYGEKLAKSISGTKVKAILLHYAAVVYYHDTESIGAPVVRTMLTQRGRWYGQQVLPRCLIELGTASETTEPPTKDISQKKLKHE